MARIAGSAKQQKFGRDKLEGLPEYFRSCAVRFVCNGECPKNRFIKTPDGQPGLNYLCAGYREFLGTSTVPCASWPMSCAVAGLQLKS